MNVVVHEAPLVPVRLPAPRPLADPGPARERDAANVAVYGYQKASPWRGFVMDKCAQDLLVYQELVHAFRPAVIIETGTWGGGSALFFADLCEMAGRGGVLSVDIDHIAGLPSHRRLAFLRGDSADPKTAAKVHEWAGGLTGLVVLDSDHRKGHVLAELDAYWDLVQVGGYLVVEDTNVNGRPVRPDFGPGPGEAVDEWLTRNDNFARDSDIEPYVTFAPGGYLRRSR